LFSNTAEMGRPAHEYSWAAHNPLFFADMDGLKVYPDDYKGPFDDRADLRVSDVARFVYIEAGDLLDLNRSSQIGINAMRHKF
jgi:hypothetical protein